MDRRRARAGALILAAAALAAAAGAAADFPIREAKWLRPEAIPRALSKEPAECLVWPNNPQARRRVAIGRTAFRAPLLLGGQAARAGMSCATCHRNGRGNPDFLFPGLSGAAGTADVTSSLMSRRRGDADFNPKPIPDLAGPPSKLKVSRSEPRALEEFIRGLVVDEFDGPEPPAGGIESLAAYARALRPEACGPPRKITLRDRLDEVSAAVALAAAEKGELRSFLLGAARSQLGAIDERFKGADAARALLRAADRDLAAIRSGEAGFETWQRRWPERRRRLMRDEGRSLFSERALRRAIAAASLPEAQQPR